MKKLAVATAVLGLVLAAAAPAQAVFVRPSQAPLLNAAGEDSTCDVTTSGRTYVQNGVRMIEHVGDVACERPWVRHRIDVKAYVVQDGQRVLLYGPGGGLSVSAGSTTSGSGTTGPICQPGAFGTPWRPQRGVPFQVILQTTATVKDTVDNSGQAWTGRSEAVVDVTCWTRG